jgi:hypothetical protein
MDDNSSIVKLEIDFQNLPMACFLLRKIANKIEDIVNLVEATKNDGVPCVLEILKKKFEEDLESESCPLLRL